MSVMSKTDDRQWLTWVHVCMCVCVCVFHFFEVWSTTKSVWWLSKYNKKMCDLILCSWQCHCLWQPRRSASVVQLSSRPAAAEMDVIVGNCWSAQHITGSAGWQILLSAGLDGDDHCQPLRLCVKRCLLDWKREFFVGARFLLLLLRIRHWGGRYCSSVFWSSTTSGGGTTMLGVVASSIW